MKLDKVGHVTDSARAIVDVWDTLNHALQQSDNITLNKFISKQNEEQDALDKKLKAGVISRDQYDAEIERLNEAKDAKDRELKIKQAKREKELALFQIAIDTSVAIGNAIAVVTKSSKNWWEILIASAAVAIDLIKAFATVNDLANVNYSGYAEGGETDISRGGVTGYRVATFGEKGPEYVIPAWERNIPVVANMEKTIEAIRTGRMQGYAGGGSTTTTNQYYTTDPELKLLMQMVLNKFSEPIKAVAYYGQDETIRIKKEILKQNNIENSAKS